MLTFRTIRFLLLAMMLTSPILGASEESPMLVRLSKLEIDPAQLDAYKAALKEEIEDSIRLEPGVLTLYAVFEKDTPNRLTILEIYASREAYESHLKTPHFIKYKTGTMEMVTKLELVDGDPLLPHLKIKDAISAGQAGAGQSAIRPESDAETSDKPQPESAERSR